MKEAQLVPEETLASFLHQRREVFVQETVRTFFEVSGEEMHVGLKERKLEELLREKLAALEFYILSGSLDHVRSHLRKSLQSAAYRSLLLSTRLRLNLLMKRIILEGLDRTFEGQPQELAAMRLALGRAVDELLLELERAWRKRRRSESQREPIMDAFFEAKRGLASEQQFMDTVMEQSPQAIVTVDKEHRILTWNPAAETITGYGREEAVGQSFAMLFASPKALSPLLSAVKSSGQIQNQEVSARRKGGETLAISISLAALSPSEELPARYLCIFGDLSEQVRAREQSMAVEKLQALASLSAAIAHEIRNPLNTLSLTIDVLEEILKGVVGMPEEEVTPRLGVLREEIDQMSEITRTYLAMGRLPVPQLEPRDLSAVLSSFTSQMGPELKGLGVTLEEDFSFELATVRLDERQFRRALRNLFRNACEAMPQGGRLRLSAREVEGSVEVSVEDAGPGIPEDFLERLFVPFQTTKDGGTGLGLYLVKEIIRAHGGSVSVENRPGGGAAVTMSIPAAGEAASRQT